MLNSTELFLNKSPLSMELDYNLLGFDSVTISKLVIFIHQLNVVVS